MKQIDIHTHIIPHRLPDLYKKFGYSGWISTHPLPNGNQQMMLDNEKFREIECNCWDAPTRIKEQPGIQVLSTIPVLFNYWAKPLHCLELATYLNDDLAKTVNENPSKFIGLGTLPMQDPELACQELRRLKELGLNGIQIGSHINDWNLDEKKLYPIWELCEELDMPVFVHPWDMNTKRMEKYWMPWLVGMPCETTIAICALIFGGVLKKFKKVRFCFAHAGGSFPFTLARIEHGFNVRPDIVATDCDVNPKEYIGRIWTDSLCHDEESLLFLIKKIGIDRVMLGSDYPFPLGELQPGKMVQESNLLTVEEKEKILFRNVIAFFGDQLNPLILQD
jgi:aminocarboxymuconate-semialdehyde decarboxylase